MVSKHNRKSRDFQGQLCTVAVKGLSLLVGESPARGKGDGLPQQPQGQPALATVRVGVCRE